MSLNNLIAYYYDTSGGHSDQEDYGPYFVPSSQYITRVRFVGAISFEAVEFDIAAGSYVLDALLIGVQYGVHGFTPVDLSPNTDAEAGSFLYQGATVCPPTPEVTTQSATADLNWNMARYPYEIDLLPQMWSGSDGVDLYLSVKFLVNPGSYLFRTFGSVWIEYGI